MKANVSTLLREFPKVRRAALSGEEVIIVTREGNLRITAERPAGRGILGALKGQVLLTADDLDEPTSGEGDWKASL
jgi:hypothetical protein